VQCLKIEADEPGGCGAGYRPPGLRARTTLTLICDATNKAIDECASASIDKSGANVTLAAFGALMTRIFIVDDHPILRDFMATMLDRHPAFKVVGVAPSIRETLETVERCGPDLMLIDLSLQDGSGLQLVRALRHIGIRTPVLIVTGTRDQMVAAEAFAVGAAGYVLKDQSPREFLAAIRAVAKGGTYVAPGVASSWAVGLAN
jgi:CheY-like chemotaxis protein